MNNSRYPLIAVVVHVALDLGEEQTIGTKDTPGFPSHGRVKFRHILSRDTSGETVVLHERRERACGGRGEWQVGRVIHEHIHSVIRVR